MWELRRARSGHDGNGYDTDEPSCSVRYRVIHHTAEFLPEQRLH